MVTFKSTYIYVKTCNHCGWKYVGKSTTNRNNVKNIYKGSGKHWENHLNFHKATITTFIINFFNETQKEECVNFCLWFSKMNNIVKSKKWANRKNENGLDGGDYWSGKTFSKEHLENLSIAKRAEKNHFYNKKHTEETKKAIGNANRGRIKSKEEIEKIAEKNRGKKRNKQQKQNISNGLKGIIRTIEHQMKLNEANRGKRRLKTGGFTVLKTGNKKYIFRYVINCKNYSKSFYTEKETKIAQKWYILLQPLLENIN